MAKSGAGCQPGMHADQAAFSRYWSLRQPSPLLYLDGETVTLHRQASTNVWRPEGSTNVAVSELMIVALFRPEFR